MRGADSSAEDGVVAISRAEGYYRQGLRLLAEMPRYLTRDIYYNPQTPV